MNVIMQTLPKPSTSLPKEKLCAGEFSPVYVREHLDSLAYSKAIGSLYIGVCGSLMKVGFSTKPEHRAKVTGIKLLAVAPARMVDELGVHEMLRRWLALDHLREYYQPNHRIDGLVSYINTNGSLPPEVTHLGDCYAAQLLARRHMRAAITALRGALDAHGSGMDCKRMPKQDAEGAAE